jgi:CPA1 family monovalent cation:H+ antiporter
LVGASRFEALSIFLEPELNARDRDPCYGCRETRSLSSFDLAALFLTAVGVCAWVNARTARLPHGIAMLFVGVGGALAILGLKALAPDLAHGTIAAITRMNFARTVLGYMLAFLLFAGAMQVDLTELRRRRLAVWTLATIGVVASTAIVGVGLWLAARGLGLQMPLAWALVFGALVSPTDPIAVLATVKRGHLSKTLQVILQGEALFNDGVGIVVFTALLAFATGASASPVRAVADVFIGAAGGLAIGSLAGALVLRALRDIDDFVVEVSLSLGLAMGVYSVAQALHMSGPIAAVAAGLLIGDGRTRRPSGKVAQAYLENFWILVDEILNALLFLLLGLQLVVVPLEPAEAGVCVAAVLLVLISRFAVVLPWGSYLHLRHKERGANTILAWGGLHGALSLALALSLPPGPQRPLILAATYAVAAFSIAVQGLTFTPLVRRLHGPAAAAGIASRQP